MSDLSDLSDLKLNSELICKSASYSGNFKLGNMILNSRNDDKKRQNKVLGLLDFKELHYRVFHERRKVINKQKYQNPNLQKDLHEFVNNKATFIFQTRKQENFLNGTTVLTNELYCKDKYDNIPPLEYFMKVDPELRIQRFYETIKCGDVLYTEVAGHAVNKQSNSLTSLYQLKVLAILDGKHRDFNNTNIFVLMSLKDAQPSLQNSVIYKDLDMNDISHEIRCWKVGTHLLVKVIHVDRENCIAYVGTHYVDHSKNCLSDIKFKQYPRIFSIIENRNDDITYTECLKNSVVLGSKFIFKKLYSCHHLDTWSSSLMKSLSVNIKDNDQGLTIMPGLESLNVNEIATSSNIRSIKSTLIHRELIQDKQMEITLLQKKIKQQKPGTLSKIFRKDTQDKSERYASNLPKMPYQNSHENSSFMCPPITPVLNTQTAQKGNSSKSRVKMENFNDDENNLIKDDKSAVERKINEEEILDTNFQSIQNVKNAKDVTKRKSKNKRKVKRKPVVHLKSLKKRKTRVRNVRTLIQKDPKKRGRPRKMENIGEDNRIKSILHLHSQAKERKFSTSERDLNKRMPLVRTLPQCNTPRISVGREDYGTLVFAKIKGWRHWPAMIVNPKDAGLTTIAQGNACIFWIGDFRVSPVPLKKIKGFVLYFREELIRPSLDENYINSVMIALKECCRRAAETDVDTKNFGALLSWATSVFSKNAQIFQPRPGSSNYPSLIALCLSRIKKFEESQSKEGQRAWKKKVEVLAAVRNGNTEIESLCISCTRPDVAVTSIHPVFDGGACKICKEEERENNGFTDFNEIKHIFCIICRCPCTEFTCDVQTCKMVYCEHCIELLVNVNAVESAKSTYNWKCFSCLPFNPFTHGLFKKRNNIASQTVDQNEKPAKMWGEYLIEKVVSKRVQNDKTEYLIKWQGLSQDCNTWEPEEHMFGIQNLLCEYKRQLKSLPSSKRKFHEDLAKDESFSSCDQPREDSAYVSTTFNKRKRICPPKVSGSKITAAIDAKNEGSPTIKKLHDTHSFTKVTNSSEMKLDNTDYGAMIWAKIQGFPWWPAMIVQEHLCGFPKMKDDEACVFWLGDNRVSKIPLKDVRNFPSYCKKSMFESPNNDAYMRAMEQALRICYERGRDSDVTLNTYTEYVSWARTAFRKDPHKISRISDLDPYPPKINAILKMIMNYREAQKEEKWEEERWELYDICEPPKSELSSISSLFGRGDWTDSKSISSYDQNSIEDHTKETTDKSEKSFRFTHIKSKKSFVSTSTSLDSDDVTSQTLKGKKGRNGSPKRKANTRVEKEMLVNENSWEVERIVRHRRKEQIIEYLIKWRGYPSSQNTWEPRINLIGCRTMLKNYINSSEKLQRSMKNSKNLSKQEIQELLKIKKTNVKEENNYLEYKEKQVATKSAELSPIKIQRKRCGRCKECEQQDDCDICKLGISTASKICTKHQCNNVEYQVCDVQTTDLAECRSTFGQQKLELMDSKVNEDVTEVILGGAIRKEDMKEFETPPRPISKKSSECQSKVIKSCIKADTFPDNVMKYTNKQMKYDSDEISPVKKEIEYPIKIQKKDLEASISKNSPLRTPPKSSTRSPLKALIISAINESAQGKLKIQEINNWIEGKVPEFGADEKNRKRIRDLLSHNRSFVKTGEDTPAYWKIANDDIEDSFVASESILQDTFAMPEKLVNNNDSEDDNLQLNLSPSIKSASIQSDDVITVCESSSSSSEDEDDDEEEDDNDENFPNDELEVTNFKPSKSSVDILKSSKQKIYLLDSTHSKLVPYKLVPVSDGQPISFTSCNTGMGSRENSVAKASLAPEQRERASPPLIDLTDPPPIIDLTQSPVSSSTKLKTVVPPMYGEGASKESVLKITPLGQKPAIKPTPLPLKMRNMISSKNKSSWYKPLSLKTQSLSYNKEDITVTVFRPLSMSSSDLSLPSTSSEKDKKSPKDSQS